MPDDLRVWVVDTSSLIQIRQAGLSPSRQAAMFRMLTRLTETGRLCFPPQVREELEWGSRRGDEAVTWVQAAKDSAERFADMNTVRRVLRRAPLLIDPHSTRDQADPYVIALAMDSQELGGVSILSDDRHDRYDAHHAIRKLSVATVAASWDIPVAPLEGFLLRYFTAE